MKIVIIGAGFTGVQLAKRLISEKNDVVILDNDEDVEIHTFPNKIIFRTNNIVLQSS